MGGEEESAFHALKEALETAPVLVLPDATKPFVINTDASEYALGAVLQQEHEGVLKPVGFMSQKLSGSQTIYPTHDKEMLARGEGGRIEPKEDDVEGERRKGNTVRYHLKQQEGLRVKQSSMGSRWEWGCSQRRSSKERRRWH